MVMWRREEPSRPSNSPAEVSTPEPVPSPKAPQQTDRSSGGSLGQDVVNLGKSVVIKGELNGSEDLTIEGRVEGKIELRQHVLTIGPNGTVDAEVFAKAVVVMGEVTGNITAAEKINIRENGSVDGDISAPRVAIVEGAQFRGSIDMQRSGSAQPKGAKGASKPGAPRGYTATQRNSLTDILPR